MWDKPRTSLGVGGFIRYARATCLNHLKFCPNQPPNVQRRAKDEVDSSPKKPRHSPYHATWLGALPAPGMVASGSGSSQMLPPSLPTSTRFNSPALYGYPAAPSPSPSLTSPLLSALPSPVFNTLPLSVAIYPPHYDQSPMAMPQSLYAKPATSQASQPVWPLSMGVWLPELQAKFETCLARLTASAGLPLSWVDNLEWIDFVHQFLPGAMSPSRKVLTTRLVPRAAESYWQLAKDVSRDQNATIQGDGWTGIQRVLTRSPHQLCVCLLCSHTSCKSRSSAAINVT